MAQQLFDDNSPAIMALAINKCREDTQMLRMLASRIVPRQKDLPVKIGPLPMNTLEDLDRASEAILKKATSGKISLSEAQEISALIEHRRLVLVARDLERRLSAVGKRLGTVKCRLERFQSRPRAPQQFRVNK